MEYVVPDALRGGASLSRNTAASARRRHPLRPRARAQTNPRTLWSSAAWRDSTYPALQASCREGATEWTRDTQTRPAEAQVPPLPHHGAPGDPACDPIEPAYALEPRSLAWLHVPCPSPALSGQRRRIQGERNDGQLRRAPRRHEHLPTHRSPRHRSPWRPRARPQSHPRTL